MSLQSDFWSRLTHIVSNVEAQLGKALQSKHGIGLSEYRALQYLAIAPNAELRMQELAVHLQLNQSSVTRLVERLEKAGYTVRDVCPDDKRGVYTVLTDVGRKRLKAALPDYEAILQNALEESEAREWLQEIWKFKKHF